MKEKHHQSTSPSPVHSFSTVIFLQPEIRNTKDQTSWIQPLVPGDARRCPALPGCSANFGRSRDVTRSPLLPQHGFPRGLGLTQHTYGRSHKWWYPPKMDGFDIGKSLEENGWVSGYPCFRLLSNNKNSWGHPEGSQALFPQLFRQLWVLVILVKSVTRETAIEPAKDLRIILIHQTHKNGHMYTYEHAYIHMHIYIYTYTYVYIYMHMYI